MRPSSMTCTQCSLSRHGAPGPVGSGRRMAKSTGTTSLPSPMTTTSNTPSMPESTRCSWPLHQVPTRPNCSPYFLNTESSPTQVHCQRLRVACTRAGGMAPQRDQHLQAQASESLDPGAFGQCTEQTRGQVLVPAPHAAQFGSWCDTQRAGETSPQRFCPTASVGSASGLRSRPPGLRGGPSHQGPAAGPRRRAAPGGGRARGAPALCDDDAVWLWRVFGASVGWRHGGLLCTVWIVWGTV